MTQPSLPPAVVRVSWLSVPCTSMHSASIVAVIHWARPAWVLPSTLETWQRVLSRERGLLFVPDDFESSWWSYGKWHRHLICKWEGDCHSTLGGPCPHAGVEFPHR